MQTLDKETRNQLLMVYEYLAGARWAESHLVFQKMMNSQDFNAIVLETLAEIIQPTAEESKEIKARARQAKELAVRQTFLSPPAETSVLVKILVPAMAAGLGYIAGKRQRKKKPKKGADA